MFQVCHCPFLWILHRSSSGKYIRFISSSVKYNFLLLQSLTWVKSRHPRSSQGFHDVTTQWDTVHGEELLILFGHYLLKILIICPWEYILYLKANEDLSSPVSLKSCPELNQTQESSSWEPSLVCQCQCQFGYMVYLSFVLYLYCLVFVWLLMFILLHIWFVHPPLFFLWINCLSRKWALLSTSAKF